MKLLLTHLTRLTYSQPVREEVMECRFGPYSDDDQRWDRFELRVKPGGAIRSYIDGFGNTGYLVPLDSGIHVALDTSALADTFSFDEEPAFGLLDFATRI